MVKMVNRPYCYGGRPTPYRGEWTKDEVMYVLKNFTRKSSWAWGGMKGFLEEAGGYVSRPDIDNWCKEYGYATHRKNGMTKMQLWHVYKKGAMVRSAGLYIKKELRNEPLLHKPGIEFIQNPAYLIMRAAEKFAKTFNEKGWQTSFDREKEWELRDELEHSFHILGGMGMFVEDAAEIVVKYICKKENFWVLDKGNETYWDWMQYQGLPK